MIAPPAPPCRRLILLMASRVQSIVPRTFVLNTDSQPALSISSSREASATSSALLTTLARFPRWASVALDSRATYFSFQTSA